MALHLWIFKINLMEDSCKLDRFSCFSFRKQSQLFYFLLMHEVCQRLTIPTSSWSKGRYEAERNACHITQANIMNFPDQRFAANLNW